MWLISDYLNVDHAKLDSDFVERKEVSREKGNESDFMDMSSVDWWRRCDNAMCTQEDLLTAFRCIVSRGDASNHRLVQYRTWTIQPAGQVCV